MLTTIETSTLQYLEEVIEKHLKTFYEVGNALLQIRDDRLYRITHKTFEDYCRLRWDISRPRAYQLMEAAGTAKALSTNVDKIPSEGVMRPLSKVEPEKRAEVYQEAVATAPEGKVTAKHVQDTVEKMKAPKEEVRYVSDAQGFATIAISQLERIRSDDPKRTEALDRVALWIENHR